MKAKPVKSKNPPCVKCGSHVCVVNLGKAMRVCSACGFEEKD